MPFAQAQETFPISPIGTQRVFPGAKITTNLSAVNHDLPSIALSGINLPIFASFQDNGKGFGTFTFEPDAVDVGSYTVTLRAISGTDTSRTTFQVNVPELPNGTKYYVDPINGNNTNPGTSASPWKTLSEVFNTGKSIQANDVLYLRSGNHGAPVINKLQSGTTYILAEKGATPMFEKLNFYLAKNWVLSGIKISPEANSTTAKGNYLRIQPTSFQITIENCEIYGTSDVMNWTTNQHWYDNAGDGVLINGTDNIFRNNYIYNIYFGITVDNVRNIVSHNLFDNYGADCIRGIASDCQFLYNRIQNALVDDYATGNHDDGFQSWTFGAPVKNMVLKGNQIFSHTDPSLPLKTSVLQGMVNFDGFSENWVVEDNLILTDHPHGLTLLGARNCKVSNNTVIANPLQLFSYGNPPWIRIGPHKNGTKSTGNLNRNNLMAFNYEENNPGTFGPNLIANNSEYFVDYAHWNFHLKPNSGPINAGRKEGGSTLDNAQHIRLDSFPDIGAYEYSSSTFDFEPPTPVSNIQLLDLNPNHLKVSWDPSSDNYQVKRYHLSVDHHRVVTDSLEANFLNLNPGNQFDLKIWAEDLAGNMSSITTLNVIMPNMPADSIVLTIPVALEDQMIQSTKEQRWIGLHKHIVGGYTFFYDASAVLPFRVPETPPDFQLISADLIINYNRLVNSPKGSADLYAVGWRNSPLVSSNDHWQGEYGTQTFGTPIQKEFLNKETLLGWVTTNDTSSTQLADYINAQVQAGVHHVFLRLNSDQENESNYRFYEFMSGDHPDTELRPRLEFLYTRIVSNQEITKATGLTVFPNPVLDKQPITINWPANTFADPITLTITNINGQVVAKRSYPISQNQLELPADILPKKGVYFLTINDLKTYWASKIVRY